METRAFADSYNQCLRDDDEDDFAFLEKQHDIGDVVGGYTDSQDDDENKENPVASVDSLEVRKALQERAREGVRMLRCCDTLKIDLLPSAS